MLEFRWRLLKHLFFFFFFFVIKVYKERAFSRVLRKEERISRERENKENEDKGGKLNDDLKRAEWKLQRFVSNCLHYLPPFTLVCIYLSLVLVLDYFLHLSTFFSTCLHFYSPRCHFFLFFLFSSCVSYFFWPLSFLLSVLPFFLFFFALLCSFFCLFRFFHGTTFSFSLTFFSKLIPLLSFVLFPRMIVA